VPAVATPPSLVGRLSSLVTSALRCLWLWTRNVLLRSPVTGEPSGPTVSMTTHGSRTKTAFLAVESIARGTLKPSRLILWTNDPACEERPPRALRRLRRRGLEICLAENWGPHTKYFPYVISTDPARFSTPLVTADDDILYPRTWLRRLDAAHRQAPGAIHCFRAHTISFESTSLLPYAQWLPCRATAPGHLTFATGVSGVIYPGAMQAELRRRGDAFVDRCRENDDVWINWVAYRARIPVSQVSDSPQHFPAIPLSQRDSLMHASLAGGRTDRLLLTTYGQEDLADLAGRDRRTSSS